MDIIHKINWVDILIMLVMLRTCYLAFVRGLSHEIFPLFGACAMVIAGLRYYAVAGTFLKQHVLNLPPDLLNLASFTAIVIATGFVCKVVGGLLDHIIKVTWHPFAEKFGGLLVGAIKSSVVAGIVIIILALVPLPYLQHSLRDKSLLGMRFLAVGPNMYAQVARFLPMLPGEKKAPGKDEIVRLLAADKTVLVKTPESAAPKP